MLLRRYEDETVRRVAAGAIANLAMNGDVDCSIFYLFFSNILDNSILHQTLLPVQLIYGLAFN
jgi:mannose/fructose/N-acetylgalactosamine-specific phosphotransferase system component IID